MNHSTPPPDNTSEVLWREDFSHGLANWWVEGEAKVWTQGGRLYADADPEPAQAAANPATTAAAIWCKTPISGDVRIDYDAHVIRSTDHANNINTFLFCADPTGRPLSGTREERRDARYSHYHHLNGYIFTFVRDFRHQSSPNADGSAKARFRIRRCPGFQLLTTAYTGHSEAGVTYHVTIVKCGGDLTIKVDGRTVAAAHDPHPWTAGLLGLRTWHTKLWWDNLRVTRPKASIHD